MLEKFPSTPILLSIYIMKWCISSASTEMTVGFLSFIALI